ncbi:MAG TPA: excinuclease ABC subunit UvrA [Spirochaetia bacterium]|nr:excinuclease ABC subunit UvrA [Spirochaetia bacterium]
MQDSILIRGARVHNLKNIDVEIPRHQLVVITGLSGSGKSSLAFDTIYAEGQRRYVESLSAYARQFLGQMDKPDVDYIGGLSPAISIDQRAASHNPRSTVGTVTEIYDYLRLLFARVGKPHCPSCGLPITSQTVQQIVDQLLLLPAGTRFSVLAPLVRGKKGEHGRLVEEARASGFLRARVDGRLVELDGPLHLEKNKRHTVEVVVDRLVLKEGVATRLAESLEVALDKGGGLALVVPEEGPETLFSARAACPECGFSVGELSPRLFSFNSPFGACEKCTGLGFKQEVDPDLVVVDGDLSLADGAIPLLYNPDNYFGNFPLQALGEHFGIDIGRPVKEMPPEQMTVILYGSGNRPVTLKNQDGWWGGRQGGVRFDGLIPMMNRRHHDTGSQRIREEIERYMARRPCPACQGARLKPEALSVKVGGLNISQVSAFSIAAARDFLLSLRFGKRDETIARQVIKEINERLGFLIDVGLDYLTLERHSGTLSGGEAQRIRLATQVGSGLVGVLYILDEPTIGLHQRDNRRLIDTLVRLRDLGNTLVVVEHDEETIRAADWVIDIGPGAGEQGGRLVAAGKLNDIMAEPLSLTGQYFSGRRAIPVPPVRRVPDGRILSVAGARKYNLKDISVDFPLGLFVCVTGVSGSGKSTLVNDIVYRHLAHRLNGARERAEGFASIDGLVHLEKVIDVDQQPIGRTPRSNAATYTGVFTHIRDLFAQLPEAKVRGYQPGRFSFNVRGGRCEACQGDGIIRIEMHFLPDVFVPCEVCGGSRYNRETLEVKYKGCSIADILNMTVDRAAEFFAHLPRIHNKLKTLQDVGLGYVRLGQPATELSGGEAQRVKLATELSRRSNGRTLYILDEPTTGLHVADVDRLLQVLHRLVENGDTVVVIEHNLDVVKTADYIIDLGPEGGEAGGRVVACGTPEEVAACSGSYTGQYLAPLLGGSRRRQAL